MISIFFSAKLLEKYKSICSREGKRYNHLSLLLHKLGAKRFEYRRTVGGLKYGSFREAKAATKLLEDDTEWIRCLQDSFSLACVLKPKLCLRFSRIVCLLI